MTYRKDIDGLRAIAVLGVIIYHSEILIGKKYLFSGGFLGVDIFFVISGYLITSIIYQESISSKGFSFLNFYERRIRRLLPALLVVLFFSIFFAYFLLLPVQFQTFLKSIISSIFFYSNFYFHFSGQAYGEAILSTKPLLHTWSLAVEEQFYILYPVLFIVSCYLFKNKIKYLFYIIILISIIFATLINQQHASFNFYMIITRAWELLAGGLIALYHLDNKKKLKNNSILSFIGFFLIIFSYIFFDDPNKHPTYLTLIPVFGCCLIIYNNNTKNLIGRFLSYKFMTNIGLISYSLYLWHHPILSFGKISGFTENNLLYKFFLITLAFILSAFTYLFIEKNFRKKKIVSKKNLGLILTPIISCFLLIIILIPKKQESQFPSIMKDLYNQTWFTTKQFKKPCFQRKNIFCNFNNNDKNQTIFLIGDSLMASIQEELKNNLITRDLNFIPMTNAGCDFLDKVFDKKNNFCNLNVQKNRADKIKQLKNSIIILHLNYKNLNQENLDEVIKTYINNIKTYLDLDYSVILIYPIPQWSINISKNLDNRFKKDKDFFIQELKDPKNHIYIDYKDFRDDTKKVVDQFDQVNHKNLYKLFPYKNFCNNIIKDRCLAHSSEDIYVIDGSHLSKKGSKILNDDLIKLIDKIKLKTTN